MAAVNVTAPEEFSFCPEDWERWFKRFERFLLVSGFNDRDDDVKISTLIYTMGCKAEEIFSSFNLSSGDAKKFNVVCERFKSYFEPKKNIIFKRALFNMRVQEEGESVDNFITALHSLAADCEYGSLKDELIRDRIVVGIKDPRVSERMQLDSQLTLSSAMELVKHKERIQSQQDIIRHDMKKQLTVEKVTAVRGGEKNRSGPSYSGKKWNCFSCGSTRKHSKDQCPAKGQKCRQCGKIGHYAIRCKNTGKQNFKVNQVQVPDNKIKQEDLSDEYYFLGTVSENNFSDEWFVDIVLNGEEKSFGSYKFKIDSGTSVSCVPTQLYVKEMGELLKPSLPLVGASGQVLQCEGYVNLIMSYKQAQVKHQIYFVHGLDKCLLGRPAINSLELLKRVNEVQPKTNKFKEDYPQLFTGLGCMKGEYSLTVKDDAQPFSVAAPRRVPLPLLSEVKQELDKMVQNEVIKPITEPTEWCAPMVVIPKPSGKVRICGDFVELNKSIIRERFELPTVDATLAKLSGAQVFTKLDANSGFYQIKLNQESAKMTTFITPFGRYCYHRLPMGISSAPEYYMRRMAQITDSLPGVLCLMDDICVFGETQEQHDERLRNLLVLLCEEGVTLNDEKCCFGVSSLKYLGYVVDAHGVHPDPDKVEAIEKFSPPTDVKGIRRFLGMVNQLAKFVPNIADKTKPLRELLSKNIVWTWSEVHEAAFRNLKSILKSADVLAHYDVNKDVILSADSSSYGLGAVLYQRHGTEHRPVAYASRSLLPAETRYATIEKESLAIAWACGHFEQYLVGKHFLVQTDHRPLLSVLKSKRLDELSPRLQRFKLKLLRYSFDITYVPGAKQVVPDAMSRAPVKGSEAEGQAAIHVQEVDSFCVGILRSLPITDIQLTRVQTEQLADPVCKTVIDYCTSSWPEKANLPSEQIQYYSVKDDLCVVEGILFKGTRLVIPSKLRLEMLSRIHQGHQGLIKSLSRARQTVWWPSITSHIKNFLDACDTCCRLREPQREPMLSSETPSYAWQRVACDFYIFMEL